MLAVGVLGLVVTLACALKVPEPREQSGTQNLESSAELVLAGQEDGEPEDGEAQENPGVHAGASF